MKLRIVKSPKGFHPYEPDDKKRFDKLADGVVYLCDVRIPRDYKKLAKFFKLCRMAYNWWEPAALDSVVLESSIFGEKRFVPQKNFERFRKDLIKMAGFCEVVVGLDGKARLEAMSISYDAMPDDDVFDQVIEKVIDVLLEHVLEDQHHADFNERREMIMQFSDKDGNWRNHA